MSSHARKSLSRHLLGLALPLLVLLVLLGAAAQLAHDLHQARLAVRTEGERLLEMFRGAASSALEHRDATLARQVVLGLHSHPGVRQASLHDHLGHRWADSSATPSPAPHWSTPLLVGPERTFAVPLQGPPPRHSHYGELAFSFSGELQARAFLIGARSTLIAGLALCLLLALGLYLLLRQQLSRPLASLIEQLARIHPDRPGDAQLAPPRGHAHDEFGTWSATVNQLLAAIARNHNRRCEAESNLQRLTRFDALTGLPNRLLLQQQLEQLLREASRHQGRLAVLCLGLDDFKAANEKHGYQAGDRLLQAVAERLHGLDGQLGSLARLGGDQFVLVQTGLQHNYEAADLAQRVLDRLARPIDIGAPPIRLHATLGITLYPEDGDSGEQLLQRAEQTMILAKQGTRSRYQFYIASIDREIRRRRQLEHDLRQALHNGELQLYYQPQLATPSHRVVAVEALLRWRHPQHGFIPPDQFIPLAEQNGLILEIGDWVLEQACRQLGDWHRQGLGELRVAVNLSTAQLRSEKLPRQVLGLTQRHGLPPYSLELEVTETGLMTDVASAAEQLRSLRRARVLVAIDDFGTGYSSLSYLKSLPLDRIKIDRSFVRDLCHNEDDATIVRTIIQLAHNLNMTVIAEGVESTEQEAYLSAHGCQEIQGYLHCRPLPVFEVTQYLLNAARSQTPAVGLTG